VPATTSTLYRGGHVRTPDHPAATALLVRGGAVAWIGRDDDAPTGSEPVEVVDLDGALVTPAFVDAHVHATSTGLALTGLDLTGTASLAEALKRVETAGRQARGGVLLGHGWDETTWPEHRAPTRQELDRASYGGVVYL
jgi:predicted amidohydrolase YtcJ